MTAEASSSRASAAGGKVTAHLERMSPLVAGAVALVLGVVLLGQKPLTSDESVVTGSASDALGAAMRSFLDLEPAALVTTLLFRPLATFTTNAWLLRAPSVVAFVAATLLAFVVARRLHGRLAGVVAGLALATAAPGVMAAQRVGSAALGIALVLGATWLLLRALDDGTSVWWAAYGATAVLLPLLHPACVGVLVAHAATTFVRTDGAPRRLPTLAFALPSVISLVLIGSVAADRWSAGSGASLEDLARAPWAATAWNLALGALALVGLVATAKGRGLEPARWKALLEGGLIAGPLTMVALAGTLVPVHTETTGTIALAGVVLAAGAGVAALPRPDLVAYACAGVALLAILGLGWWYAATPAEDWRAAARVVEQAPRPDTVVVVPDRSANALERELGGASTRLRPGGDVVAVVVLDTSANAVDAARRVVPTPRYALLAERRVSDDIVVQRWIRP